ncbi:MAG: hypothetical protein WCJ93_12300 [Methanomicrobiales archaeon]
MQILKTNKFKRCVDGTVLKEYFVDEVVTRETLSYFEDYGKVKILENLKQPFFSFLKEEFFSIKGMVGDQTLYVRYHEEHFEESHVLFTTMIERWIPGELEN